TAVPAHFADRHAIDADTFERFFDLIELEGLDDRLNLFHVFALRLRLQDIAFLAAHAQIQPLDLLVFVKCAARKARRKFENDKPGDATTRRTKPPLPSTSPSGLTFRSNPSALRGQHCRQGNPHHMSTSVRGFKSTGLAQVENHMV